MTGRKVWGLAAALAAFVIVAMCSVASAAPESMVVDPDNQTIAPGGIVNYEVKITGIQQDGSNHKHTIKAWVSNVSGSGSKDDLLFKFHHGSNSSGWLKNNDTWNWWDGGANSATLTLSVKHNGTSTDAVYQFKVEDGYKHGNSWDDARATVYAAAIPEFTTIAIPVAAILGLLLFFNRRKRSI